MSTFYGQALFQLFVDCVAEQDEKNIMTIGLTDRQISCLMHLSPKELKRLSELSSFKINVNIEDNLFDTAIKMISEERTTEYYLSEYIKNDASYKMVYALFGTPRYLFLQRQKELRPDVTRGRKSLRLGECMYEEIWTCWGDNKELALADRYLETAKITGVSLGSLWVLINKWETTTNTEEDSYVRAI